MKDFRTKHYDVIIIGGGITGAGTARKTLKQVLSADLVRVYYYQRGGIENSLQWDKQWQAATKLLLNEDEYNKVLAPTIAKQTTESHK